MKELVYLVLSSMVILGIVVIVLSTFNNNKQTISNVVGANNQTANLSIEGILDQGDIFIENTETYNKTLPNYTGERMRFTGDEVLEILRFYKDDPTKIIVVMFETYYPKTLGASNRENDMNEIEDKFAQNVSGYSNLSYNSAQYTLERNTAGTLIFKRVV